MSLQGGYICESRNIGQSRLVLSPINLAAALDLGYISLQIFYNLHQHHHKATRYPIKRTDPVANVMAPLLKLPIELLELALQDTHPRDLEAFFQISKAIRQKGTRLLEKHYSFKRMYSTFTFHDDTCRGDLARMLKTVLDNPRIADYVVEMEVEGCRLNFQDSVEAKASYLRYDVEDSTPFTKAVIDSKYIDQSVKESMVIEILEGDELPIITVLLTLLPNLKYLSLSDVSLTYLVGTVRSIVQERPTKVLPYLKDVDIEFEGLLIPEDFYKQLFLLHNLCSLPSLRSLSVDQFGCVSNLFDPGQGLVRFFPRSRTPVTSISFWRCALDLRMLFGFLARTDGLLTFEFLPNPQSPHLDMRLYHNPFVIRAVLHEYCRKSLKKLTLRSDHCSQSFMGSLRTFTVLEDLTTNFILLVGRPGQNQRALAEVLPPSIRSISLYVCAHQDDGTLKGLFEELLVAKQDRLPQIESFKFKCEQWATPLRLIFEDDGREILQGQELPPEPAFVARPEANWIFYMTLQEAKSAPVEW